MIIGFTFLKGNKLKNEYNYSYNENTQIPIFEFKYLQRVSNIFGNDATG
jgi:hypothetical protein